MRRIDNSDFNRNLIKRRDDLIRSFKFVNKLFEVDTDDYIKEYDVLSKEMTKTYQKMIECQNKLNDLDYKCERFKSEFLVKNNIDLKERLEKVHNREEVLSEMFKNGFISSDMYDAIKTSYWNSRKKFNYEFAKWL
jgi:nicotinic acid phosphoribosyltransferase|tara:strand:- start:226 stop:633 length:408 start_codon:yes stop_codon:yes gene_type:complete